MALVPDLSIIIINWNSVRFLRKCLASIDANTKNTSFEVIVIDNASGDGCGDMLRTKFPRVRFVQSSTNLGFAAANNLGVQHASGKCLLFLNPDTELAGPAIDRMMEFLEAHNDAGIVGAKLLNSDLSIQTSCIQNFPTVLNRVIDAELLRRLFPMLPFWGTRPLLKASDTTAQVEVISGACQMIRRELFDRVGGFDASYFMYAEDADLCMRTHRSKSRNYYVGCAVVIHHGGQSSGTVSGGNFTAIMMRESLHSFFRQNYGRMHAFVYRSAMALSAVLRLILLAGAALTTLGLVRRNALLRAIAKWKSIFRWTIGLEMASHN